MEQNEVKSNSKSTIIGALVLVIFAAAIVFGAYYYLNIFGKTTKKTTTTTTKTPASKTTPTPTPGSTEDVDNEINTLDASINSVTEDDFAEVELSDTNLGL